MVPSLYLYATYAMQMEYVGCSILWDGGNRVLVGNGTVHSHLFALMQANNIGNGLQLFQIKYSELQMYLRSEAIHFLFFFFLFWSGKNRLQSHLKMPNKSFRRGGDPNDGWWRCDGAILAKDAYIYSRFWVECKTVDLINISTELCGRIDISYSIISLHRAMRYLAFKMEWR